MLLRRVIEHVRTQNWTAIAIDLVIVVVGVFIGIQVSNWNDARVDRSRALSYLERIHADLTADLLGYQNRLAFWGAVSDYGATALAYADGDAASDLDEWDILLAYFQASQVAEFYTTQTTYDELRNGGELGLVGDPELRDALAYYYTNAYNPALTERPSYREHVRQRIPFDLQLYIWKSCFESDEFSNQSLLPCDAPPEPDMISATVRELASNQSLTAELRYWMSTMYVASTVGRDRIRSTIRLREMIAEKLPDLDQDR